VSEIVLRRVGKTYAQYERTVDRLLEVLTGRKRHLEFIALHPVDLDVSRGEVLGLIGMNGAGKSTLLKLIAGTILPTSGQIDIHGRISALLELGAGFHPEMTGRENVYLSGTVMGLSLKQIDTLYDEIVAFSGLAEFMNQPVKTFSSGMFVRLAFAVATSVQPDILIVDEALSVGDGAFARKSFERIMSFKEAGGTILFCSHSLYQVEAICSRVIWVHHGKIVMDGDPAVVTTAYGQFLDTGLFPGEERNPQEQNASYECVPAGMAHLARVEVAAGGSTGHELDVESGKTDVAVTVRFVSDPALATPSVAVTFVRQDGGIIASAGSLNDGQTLERRPDGSGDVIVIFPRLALLKGEYWLNVYLLCEQGLHIYDQAAMVSRLRVSQQGLEQGVVSLPRQWSVPAPGAGNLTQRN
jgi:lipopolysaccharide transport system ATP-binding protein